MKKLSRGGGYRYLAADAETLKFAAELLPVAGRAVDIDYWAIKTGLTSGGSVNVDGGRRERRLRRRDLDVVGKGMGYHVGDGTTVGRTPEVASFKRARCLSHNTESTSQITSVDGPQWKMSRAKAEKPAVALSGEKGSASEVARTETMRKRRDDLVEGSVAVRVEVGQSSSAWYGLLG